MGMLKSEFIEMIGIVFATEPISEHKIKVLNIEASKDEDSFEVTYVALDPHHQELPKRNFRVRETFRQGWTVNHGIVMNPTNVIADIIQKIIVGEIAKECRLLNGAAFFPKKSLDLS
jgi:hypothetical protein